MTWLFVVLYHAVFVCGVVGFVVVFACSLFCSVVCLFVVCSFAWPFVCCLVGLSVDSFVCLFVMDCMCTLFAHTVHSCAFCTYIQYIHEDRI